MQAALQSRLVAPARPQLRASRHVFTASKAAPRLTCRRSVQVTAQAAAAEAASSSAAAASAAGVADTYAVVELGGHQLIVEEGRWYTVNRLEAEPGSKIQLGRVLALKQGGTFRVGQPYMADVRVEAEVLEELKGPKVIVFKYKPKKHYRRTNGHRQPLTKILITKISS